MTAKPQRDIRPDWRTRITALRVVVIAVTLSVPLLVVAAQFITALTGAEQLTSQRQKWQSAGISDYDLRVHVVLDDICGLYDLSVRDGRVLEAAQVDAQAGKSLFGDYFAPDNPYVTPLDPAQVTPFTLDALFDRASESIASMTRISLAGCSDAYYDLAFDPELGYIRAFTIVDQQGLCTMPVCSDPFCCPPGFRVISFEEIE